MQRSHWTGEFKLGEQCWLRNQSCRFSSCVLLFLVPSGTTRVDPQKKSHIQLPDDPIPICPRWPAANPICSWLPIGCTWIDRWAAPQSFKSPPLPFSGAITTFQLESKQERSTCFIELTWNFSSCRCHLIIMNLTSWPALILKIHLIFIHCRQRDFWPKRWNGTWSVHT